MKYLKYILVFSIPAILGIYYGFGSRNSPDNLSGYIESPDTDPVTEVDSSIAKAPVKKTIDFDAVRQVMTETPGTYSVYIKDLRTNVVYEQNSDYFYNAASVFKVFVAVSVMQHIEQNDIGLDYTYKITPADYETGTGILQYEKVGTTYPVSELLSLSMKKSDNVAQNILIRAIKENYIRDSTFPEDNETSARKIGIFLENFYENKYISEESRDYLLNLMKQTDFDDRIDVGLSRSVEFAHKIGNWPTTSSWHDCGIVFGNKSNVVVCLMSKGATFEDFVSVASDIGLFVENLVR